MFRTNALCRTLTALSAGVLLQSPLQAQEVDNRANIYGGLNYQMFDDDWQQHNKRGHFYGGELPISERWGLALEQWKVDTTRKQGAGDTDNNYVRLGGNYHLDLVGDWQPYVGVGMGHHKLTNNFPRYTDSETAVDVGFGMKKFFNDNFFVRGDIKAIRVFGVTNTDLAFNLGVGYAFGAKPSRPVAAAPAPAPAARPTPPPAPRPEPEPPRLMEVTLQASALFDFDRSEIKPAGRQELDQLVRDINALDYDVVLVTGHTDRIGSREYNLDLSQRRADAVRTYLVNAGVPAARITARGVNGDDPVTRPDQCRNTGSAANQIACLEPDRRVVVIVTGTRPVE